MTAIVELVLTALMIAYAVGTMLAAAVWIFWIVWGGPTRSRGGRTGY